MGLSLGNRNLCDFHKHKNNDMMQLMMKPRNIHARSTNYFLIITLKFILLSNYAVNLRYRIYFTLNSFNIINELF